MHVVVGLSGFLRSTFEEVPKAGGLTTRDTVGGGGSWGKRKQCRLEGLLWPELGVLPLNSILFHWDRIEPVCSIPHVIGTSFGTTFLPFVEHLSDLDGKKTLAATVPTLVSWHACVVFPFLGAFEWISWLMHCLRRNDHRINCLNWFGLGQKHQQYKCTK